MMQELFLRLVTLSCLSAETVSAKDEDTDQGMPYLE